MSRLLKLLTARSMLAFAVVAWFVAVFWCWSRFLPLKSTLVATSGDLQLTQGLTANGLVVSVQVQSSDVTHGIKASGPIRVWDPLAQHLVREVGVRTDRFLGSSVRKGCNLVAFDHEGVIQIYDVASGALLGSHQPIAPPQMVRFSGDGRQYSVKCNRASDVVDLRTGAIVWTAEDRTKSSYVEFIGPDLMQCSVEGPPEGQWQTMRLNTRTLRPDDRFPESSGIIIDASDDGCLALCHITGRKRTSVHDYRTGERLWSLPDGVRAQFGRDGTEVWELIQESDSIRIARWRAADGTVLAPRPAIPPKPKLFDFSVIALSPDSRFVVALEDSDPLRLPALVQSRLERWCPAWTESLTSSRPRFGVYAAPTGKRVGAIAGPDEAGLGLTLRFCEGGVLVGDPWTQSRFSSLPPSRNWMWLLGWGLGPCLPLIAVRIAVAFNRRQQPRCR